MSKAGFAGWIFCVAACLTASPGGAWAGRVPAALRAVPHVGPAGTPLEARVLEAVSDPPAAVTDGALDARFTAFVAEDSHAVAAPRWFRLALPAVSNRIGSVPVVVARAGMDQRLQLFGRCGGRTIALTSVAVLPQFAGAEDTVFGLPPCLDEGAPLYAHMTGSGPATADLHFSAAGLEDALRPAAEHARIIALAFGALMAMALSTLLVRFVLTDRLYPLYGTLFSLQALYLAYFSGEGFHWPILGQARPLSAYAWNVPIALSAAAAALFVREFANLRLFSGKVYSAFGWLALAYVVLAASNVLRLVGLGWLVAAVGNLMFVGSAAFTLIVSLLAWRSGIRAAGWFLVAWGLLCGFQIATALYLLYGEPDNAQGLIYYGLAPSMVAAAVLIALGTSDRVRQQRLALTDAERRAQTDPLTGVLNRRSLIERLDAACMRAKARGLPLSVLFIDLDHFKQINDSYGHAAGDACLAAIIAPIHAELRQSDIIGRYGGEEFVVILSGADAVAAHPIAERICQRVAEVRIEGFGMPIRLTCSIGVAASDTLGVWGQHLVAHADTAQYAAKRSGRNRVQLAATLAA